MGGLPLYIRLFGPLCVQCGEQEIHRFGTIKNAELLAYLAYYPGSHARAKLAELLWPEQEEDKSRRSLNQAVYTLKSLFTAHEISSDNLLISYKDQDTLQLDSHGFTTDVAAFKAALRAAKAANTDAAQAQRHLQRAVRLSASDFLEGHYSEWANDERNRLAARLDEAIEELGHTRTSAIFNNDEAISQDGSSRSETTPFLRFSGPRTRFFGRAEEIHDVCTLLHTKEARIVTLTGMAGVGKTRLAMESARQMTDAFGQDMHFVPLADIRDARQILTRLLHTLALYENDPLPPVERIIAHFQGRAALLILDNFEQLVGSGAALVGMLLNQLPGLKVLVTSRQALNLNGEHELAVPPLPVPAVSEPVETLPECPSVALFQNRVQQKRLAFRVTSDNAPTIIEICRKLEGIPLAIELAAGAVGQVKTPAKLLAGLNRRFELLVSTPPCGEARHHSLQAALEWSWELLTPPLRQFFAQLSVFQDGWTAEAAQNVCRLSPDIMFLELLQARSLIVLDEAGEEMRYRMLETIREFGNERLTAEEQNALADEHARYFIGFAKVARLHITGATQKEWIERVERERSNLYAALELTCLHSSPELPRDLIEVTAQMWFGRGYYSEGQELIAGLLPKVTHPDTRAIMLNVAGVMAEQQGDYDTATVYFQECLCLAQAAANLKAQTNALGNLGLIAWKQGRVEEARVLFEESLPLDRELGDARNIIITRLNLSNVLQAQNDIAGARQINTENLELAHKEEDVHAMAWSLGNLGQLARLEGDLTQALDCCRESLAILAEMPDEQGMATMLEEIAFTMQAQGQNEGALRLLGTAAATRERLQTPLAPIDRPAYEACLAATRDALSEKSYKRIMAKGRATPLAQVAASLLKDSVSR